METQTYSWSESTCTSTRHQAVCQSTTSLQVAVCSHLLVQAAQILYILCRSLCATRYPYGPGKDWLCDLKYCDTCCRDVMTEALFFRLVHVNQKQCQHASVCLQEPGTMDSVRSGPYGQIFRPVSCSLAGCRFLAFAQSAVLLLNTCCCRTTSSLDRQELETTGQRVTIQKVLSL